MTVGSETKEVGIDHLVADRAKHLVTELLKLVPYVNELDGITKGMQDEAVRRINEYALSVKMSKVNPEYLDSFFKKPYPRLRQVKGRSDTWELALPKFIDVQIGWLESQDDSFNYFQVSRAMDWLEPIPEALKKQLGWKPPPELILEGEDLVGSKEALAEAKEKYKGMVREVEEGKLRVDPKHSFDLLASLIRDGVKPFSKKPVDKGDLIERRFDFELRPYQKAAWEKLKEYSNIGCFFPPSTGKTIIILYACTHLKPPHLVTVPTRLLKEQWEDRIEAHTDLKLDEEIFVMTYQRAIKESAAILARLGVEMWSVKALDEVQHWPSNWFSKMAFIPSRYGIGASATPYREDGREEYIFALTGVAVGLPWDEFKRSGIIRSPTCSVWIVKGANDKMKQLATLAAQKKKTVIFCDYIESGKMIAGRFDTQFAYGATKDNLKMIRSTLAEKGVVVVSRVGDEGLSLPEIENVVEFTFNYGSRRQELQRFGRLLHSQEKEVEHHIIMTLEEYVHDRKRLFSVMEKGFKIVLHREGISDKVIERETQQPTQRRPRAVPEKKESSGVVSPQQPLAPSNPLLSSKGVQNAMALMKGMERSAFEFLIANDTNWITDEKLAFHLGSLNKLSLQKNIRFQWMRKNGWIERQKIEDKMASRTRFREIVG